MNASLAKKQPLRHPNISTHIVRRYSYEKKYVITGKWYTLACLLYMYGRFLQWTLAVLSATDWHCCLFIDYDFRCGCVVYNGFSRSLLLVGEA